MDVIETAIRQVIGHKYPQRSYTKEIETAIKEGYVKETDPNWHYSDAYNAGIRPWVTEKGEEYARNKGWICKCKGNIEKPCENLADGDFCYSCFGSAGYFGVYFEEDNVPSCGMHLATRRPDIVEIRRKLKNPAWIPDDVRREIMKVNALGV